MKLTKISKQPPIEFVTIGVAGEDIPEYTVVRYDAVSGTVLIGASADGEQVSGITDKIYKEGSHVSVIKRGEAFAILLKDEVLVTVGEKLAADTLGNVIKYDSVSHSFSIGIALEDLDATGISDQGVLVSLEITS